MGNNKLKQTPSQTVGPYFSYGLTPEQGGYDFKSITSPILVKKDTLGEHIILQGHIYDGNGDIIPDAMIEIYQADHQGKYISKEIPPSDDVFTGFGRCDCETNSNFCFKTIKPGSIGDGHAPHINMVIFMRGLLSHAYSRVYFSDEMDANHNDNVLNNVPSDRRATLIAKRTENENGDIIYQFDLNMQGINETVFFDV